MEVWLVEKSWLWPNLPFILLAQAKENKNPINFLFSSINIIYLSIKYQLLFSFTKREMNPQNYFVECNIKTSKNKYSNTKWDCDFTDITIPEGSQITLSSAYINSVGAGDLISINQSGDEQNNQTRLITNFYSNNDALNMKREGYQFSADNKVYQDVDNKPMLLHRWTNKGQLTNGTQIYPYAKNLAQPIEDAYVPGIWHGDFVLPKIGLQAPGDPITSQLTFDIDIGPLVPKYEPGTYPAIRFNIGNDPANAYLYNTLMEGTFIYLYCKIPYQGSEFLLNGMCFIDEVNATDFVCQLTTQSINHVGFTQFATQIVSFQSVAVNYIYGIPCCMMEDSRLPGQFINIPYILPDIDRTSVNSYLPPVGTRLYNYTLSLTNYNTAEGEITSQLTESTNTLLDKHVDTTRSTEWQFPGTIVGDYTTLADSNLQINYASAQDYNNAVAVIEEYGIMQISLGNDNTKKTYSAYVYAGKDNTTQIITFQPLYESIGFDDTFCQITPATYTAGTKANVVSLYNFMQTWLGVHVNTNNGFLTSNDNIFVQGTTRILTLFSTEPNIDTDVVPMTNVMTFAKKIYISNTTRPANDFAIHYRYKDIVITDLSYVSPSDLATEVTKQLHELTDALDNTGTPIPNSKLQSIPQNEFLFPIWFPWNVEIDTNYAIQNINLLSANPGSQLLEFTEPDDVNNYWIMNDGTVLYGMLQRTVANTDYGIQYTDLTQTFIPIGAFIWIHNTYEIPNVDNKVYVFYPTTRYLAINYGDMTSGTNGYSDFPVVYEEPFDIDQSTLDNYTDIVDAQVIIGFPIRYIPGINSFISQMIGTNNATLSYDEDISKFSLQLFHQPYTSPYDIQTASGGDNSVIIYFPSCVNPATNIIYKNNLTRLGGINIVNYMAPIIQRGVSQISPSYQDPTNNNTVDSIGSAFWQMLGFDQDYLIANSGYDYDVNNQLVLKGTTDALLDSSDGIITASDNGVNYPRYIEANVYQDTTSATPTAEQAKYRFSSLTGQNLNNASLGYSNAPNTAGSGNVVDFVKFTQNIDVKNKNGDDVRVHSTGDINLLASICNPDRQRQRFYVVKVDSGSLTATGLPQKEKEPFFYILSNIVDDGSYITSTPTRSPIVGIVSKLNSALDYFYSYVSPLTFTMQKTRTVTSISIEITTSKLGVPLLVDDSSIMIFQITIPPMSIPADLPTIQQTQAEAQYVLDQLALKEPRTGEPLQQIMLADMFPLPSSFDSYDTYLSTTQDNPPLSKAKYTAQIRLRKKYADMKAVASKIQYIGSILGIQPEDIPINIFDSIITKANQFN